GHAVEGHAVERHAIQRHAIQRHAVRRLEGFVLRADVLHIAGAAGDEPKCKDNSHLHSRTTPSERTLRPRTVSAVTNNSFRWFSWRRGRTHAYAEGNVADRRAGHVAIHDLHRLPVVEIAAAAADVRPGREAGRRPFERVPRHVVEAEWAARPGV